MGVGDARCAHGIRKQGVASYVGFTNAAAAIDAELVVANPVGSLAALCLFKMMKYFASSSQFSCLLGANDNFYA